MAIGVQCQRGVQSYFAFAVHRLDMPRDAVVPGVLQVLIGKEVIIVAVADMGVTRSVQRQRGAPPPHLALAVHRFVMPGGAVVPGVLQVPIGVIMVADVGMAIGVQPQRGIFAHPTLAIHRLDVPVGHRRAILPGGQLPRPVGQRGLHQRRAGLHPLRTHVVLAHQRRRPCHQRGGRTRAAAPAVVRVHLPPQCPRGHRGADGDDVRPRSHQVRFGPPVQRRPAAAEGGHASRVIGDVVVGNGAHRVEARPTLTTPDLVVARRR